MSFKSSENGYGFLTGEEQQLIDLLNPLSANPTKWSNTLKQFVCFYQRIV